MLVVLGNVTVVVMVALSGERCRRQRKSDGKNHQQTKIAKLRCSPQVGLRRIYIGSNR
jgi:hypothetical protein